MFDSGYMFGDFGLASSLNSPCSNYYERGGPTPEALRQVLCQKGVFQVPNRRPQYRFREDRSRMSTLEHNSLPENAKPTLITSTPDLEVCCEDLLTRISASTCRNRCQENYTCVVISGVY